MSVALGYPRSGWGMVKLTLEHQGQAACPSDPA